MSNLLGIVLSKVLFFLTRTTPALHKCEQQGTQHLFTHCPAVHSYKHYIYFWSVGVCPQTGLYYFWRKNIFQLVFQCCCNIVEV